MAESAVPGSLRRQMLREMGLQPLRWRGRPAPPDAAVDPAATAPAQASSARSEVSNSGTHRVPEPARGARGDPFWQALLQAAGAPRSDPATLGWEERLDGPAFDFDGPTLRINPIALRQQPQAKRALWKTLRALRRRLLDASTRTS